MRERKVRCLGEWGSLGFGKISKVWKDESSGGVIGRGEVKVLGGVCKYQWWREACGDARYCLVVCSVQRGPLCEEETCRARVRQIVLLSI